MLNAAGATSPRIGPNAILRTLEALRERNGATIASAVFAEAGLDRYTFAPPADMVPEEEVVALARAMRGRLAPGEAERVAALAGEKTADYLLAHRIPKLAQYALRPLPARVAAPVLLSSIGKHTWTFAGSARVTIRSGPPARVEIAGCPICRDATATAPLCRYYGATFERLFRELVAKQAVVREVSCEARGERSCVFEIAYGA